jgi:hypothetical protein
VSAAPKGRGKRRRRVAIPVFDVTHEVEAQRKALAASVDELMARCREAAAAGRVDASRVADLMVQHEAFKAQLAADQALTDNLRMMHAAQKLHGWTTLEQVEAATLAAQAGDPEAIRAIVELVELVQNGLDGKDVS